MEWVPTLLGWILGIVTLTGGGLIIMYAKLCVVAQKVIDHDNEFEDIWDELKRK